jgi:hypothetical protein
MEPPSTALTKIALAIIAAVFAVEVYQAATLPIASQEAYLYDRFVRPPVRQVLAEELPDRDVLYVLLEKRSVGLFHVSPFSVRLPSLLFGLLFLWSIWQITSAFFIGGIIASVLPLAFGWFSRADGTGAAIALIACAIALAMNGRAAGICLGLAVAARLDFAIPAAIVAMAILAFQKQWNQWVDRVLIPSLVVALIVLALPLSHAHASAESTPELTAAQSAHLASALRVLRASAGTKPIRIAATSAVEPVANFYRARWRASTWDRVTRDDSKDASDYYLLPASREHWATERHLIVLYRDVDFLLVQRAYD